MEILFLHSCLSAKSGFEIVFAPADGGRGGQGATAHAGLRVSLGSKVYGVGSRVQGEGFGV